VHEIHHLLEATVSNKSIAPYGTDFEDGYKNAAICDGILQSAASGQRVNLKY
jgi:predicted dehydrogenase